MKRHRIRTQDAHCTVNCTLFSTFTQTYSNHFLLSSLTSTIPLLLLKDQRYYAKEKKYPESLQTINRGTAEKPNELACDQETYTYDAKTGELTKVK